MRVFILLPGYAQQDAEMAVLSISKGQRAHLRKILEKKERQNLFAGKVVVTSGKPDDIVILGPEAKKIAGMLEERLQG